jgi:transposase
LLRELLQAREALVEALKHEANQAEHATGLPLLESLAGARRALLQQHIKQIDAEMERVIAAERALSDRAARCAQAGFAD